LQAALFGSARVLHWLLELNIMDIDQPDSEFLITYFRKNIK